MEKIFRALIIIYCALYIIWFFQPYNNLALYDQASLTALSLNGYGAYDLIVPISSLILTPALILSCFLLWFFVPVGRIVFTILVVITLATLPFSGLTVQTGLDFLISQIAQGAAGIILFMCYFSSISSKFTHNKSSNLTGAENAPPS